MSTNPTVEEIKQIIFQLPIQEQIILKEELEERLETLAIMQISETGSQNGIMRKRIFIMNNPQPREI